MTTLFDKTMLGAIPLANRMVMAPMTRSRAGRDGRINASAATYYSQRASAGLIVTEGIFPTPEGIGYMATPGLADAAQAEAWAPVVAAVHAAGGRIVAQLMHAGRISHPSLQPGQALPVAPSAIRPKGQVFTYDGPQDFVTPRALTEAEIAAVIAGHAEATRRALAAGFDGVELHGASGYLAEQFLSSGSNARTDDWGGSAENRGRFLRETLQAMIAVSGPGRVGLKLSPEMGYNDITDADPVETYGRLVASLPEGLAYLNVTLINTTRDWHAILRPLYRGNYLVGGGLTAETAAAALRFAQGAVFGQAFLANPDLPARFAKGAPLTPPDRATFFMGGETGYTDYPKLEA